MTGIAGPRGRKHSRPKRRFWLEWLEDRTVLSVALSLTGAQTLVPGANINVSDQVANVSIESEMSVDVNPANPLNVAGFSHDLFQAGNPNNLGRIDVTVYYSLDGGVDWNGTLIRDLGGADGIPGPNDDGMGRGSRFDPSIKFDDTGALYIAYGFQDRDPNTNVSYRTKLVVARSDDGGATFNQFTVVDDQANNQKLTEPGVDKWMLATGLDPSTGNQAVYVAYTQNVPEFTIFPVTETDQRIVVAGSNDGGVTFTRPRTINDASVGDNTDIGNLFAKPAVGPNGELYVVWHDIDAEQVLLDRDLDGLWGNSNHFGTDQVVRSLRRSLEKATSIGGDPVEAQPNRGIHTGPVLDVDRSGGPHNGRLYVTFVDVDMGTDPDVYLTVSDNSGKNWHSYGIIGPADAASSTDFLPWVAVDQTTGSVNVVFYTTSGDENTGDNDVHVWLGSSLNGGANFTGTYLTTFRSRASAATATGGADFLEYIGVAAHDGTIHGLWTDNRRTGGGGGGANFQANPDAYTASASLHSASGGNTLTVTGDDPGPYGNDHITIGRSAANANFLEVRVDDVLEFAGLLATLDSIIINGARGNDVIEILTDVAGVRVTVNGGRDNDTVNITPDIQSLDFLSSLTIHGGGGSSDTLNVYDQANPYSHSNQSQQYTLTETTVSRWYGVRSRRGPVLPVLASITYDGVEDLRVYAGARDDDILVSGTAEGTSTTVYAGRGNDEIRVGTRDAPGMLAGPLDVRGQLGRDHLTIHDEANPHGHDYTITSSAVTRSSSALITYDSVSQLVLNAGNAMDTIDVQSTNSGTATFVHGGGRTDTINVASAAGSLDDIDGLLTIDGGGGIDDTLNIGDLGDTDNNTYTVSVSAVRRSGGVTIGYLAIGLLNLYAGTGDDIVNVTVTNAATSTFVNTWSGDDTINVGSSGGSLDFIRGPLYVEGSFDDDGDTLNLGDLGDTNASTYVLDEATFERTGTARIDYGTIETVNLYAGTGDDTIYVEGTNRGTATLVDGWAGDDTIIVDSVFVPILPPGVDIDPGLPLPRDTILGPLTVRGSFDDDTLNLTDVENFAASTYTLTATTFQRTGLALVTYETFETLNLYAGSGDDTITLDGVGVDTAAVDGGFGADTLDYSSYTASVTVNLLMDTATDLAGGILRIENASGGSGDDLLVGNAAANVLVGGAGRDVIIGGPGVDALLGGEGDDLLIGGTTTHDADAAALAAIRDEWERPDQTSYEDRVYHLLSGGGLNGLFLLDAAAVVDDGAANTLTGEIGRDCFFVNAFDVNDWDQLLGEQLVTLAG